MNEFELVAEKREDVGKGASRRLRHAGKLPGIVYGTDKEPTMITLDHNAVMHSLDNEAFYSHILTLKTGKASEKVVLKDLQRHPYKRLLMHIDLLRVNENEALTMRVPIHFINEEKAVGVKQGGGVVSHVMTEIDVVCLPKDLPEYIQVDMLEVEMDQTVHLSDLVLPEGVQLYSRLHGGEDSLPVAAIHAPKASAVDDAEDAAAAEAAEESAEGEEAPKDSEG
ncbi:MAG: 50S ribosomal protein L25/general stress protein Ctc [Proteobacteria bacterium]|nr:50S ribosomal protein L25/general stress protein Ctc [Pseudomonadota bacterium]NOG61517.1 50S ribosomal protein L25/general stress protein Ctc [Pseudomonadota bacterium]